jgi:flagellar biosynthesis/type III secretory pathway protein FliH
LQIPDPKIPIADQFKSDRSQIPKIPIARQILRSYAEAEHDRSIAELERAYEQQARREAEAIAEQERAEKIQERIAKEQAEMIADQANLAKELAEQKAQRLAERLRALGLDPDEI